MGKYVVSENISTMAGLNIPLLNIRDFANPDTVSEVTSETVTTLGYKQLSMPAKIVAFSTSDSNFSRLNDASVALRKESDNIINMRITLSSNTVKYYCVFDGDGTCFCDVNQKEPNGINDYQYAFFTHGGTQHDKFAILYYESADGRTYYTPYSWNHDWTYGITTGGIYFYDISEIGDFTIYEKSDEYGNYSGAGGYDGGGFDDSSDSFGLPELPQLGISEIGFINVYNPSVQQLTGLADDLFPDITLPQPSQLEGLDAVAENLANTCDTIGKFAETFINQNLINYVIDCHIVPVRPTTANNEGLKIGFKTFNYNPHKVLSDYVAFNCGVLEIGEYYHNFLDYVGTRAKLYLPFVGFVNVNPEWFIGGRLQVLYHFNVIDGSCIAFIIGTSSKSKLLDTVVATFGGNCCVHIPITGVNYSSMISGVVSGGSQIVSGISNGSIANITSGALGILDAHPDLQQSNSYNAGMSYMCYRKPYLIIERPVADFSKNYPHEKGLPLNATYQLKSLSGFTQCEDINFNVNFTCTEEEKNMIKDVLRKGVIL